MPAVAVTLFPAVTVPPSVVALADSSTASCPASIVPLAVVVRLPPVPALTVTSLVAATAPSRVTVPFLAASSASWPAVTEAVSATWRGAPLAEVAIDTSPAVASTALDTVTPLAPVIYTFPASAVIVPVFA